MSFRSNVLFLSSLALLSGCFGSKDSAAPASSPTTSVGALTTAIQTMASGVEATGDGLASTVFTESLTDINSQAALVPTLTPMSSALCAEYGMPKKPASEITDPTDPNNYLMNNSDTRYPYVFTYCAMTVSEGDTVRGGFELAESLICSLEKGGLEFNGVLQSITINFTDTTCWPNGGPGGPSGPTTGTIQATGSSPASFNSYFEKGVIFTYVEGSDTLTFKFAANITSSLIEFVGLESWSTGNKGVMGGKLDKTTGVLQFEKRDERIRNCGGPCSGSSGWNRHTRIYADLTMTGGEPSGLESFSYAFSDVQADDPAAPTNGYGQLMTASGSLTTGIKSRYFSNSSTTSAAGLKNHANYSETANSLCMNTTGIDVDSTACSIANSGIDKFSTDAKFTLFGSTAHVTPENWLANYSGFTFTTADPNVDQAF